MTLEEINNLKDTIEEWFDLSAIGLTDDDLIVNREVKPIIFDSEGLDIFNRLKSKFNSYLLNDLFSNIRKSNIFTYIYYNKTFFNFSGISKDYYNGFEVEIIFRNYYYYNDKKLISIAELLQTTIETFKLTLKQDNILDNYTFKVVVYNKSNNFTFLKNRYLNILLLNIKELKKNSK